MAHAWCLTAAQALCREALTTRLSPQAAWNAALQVAPASTTIEPSGSGLRAPHSHVRPPKLGGTLTTPEPDIDPAALELAIARMDARASDEDVKAALLHAGSDPSTVDALVSFIRREHTEAGLADARTEIVRGIVLLGIGLGITALTYALAAPGGAFLVTWGAVVYGAVSLRRGVDARAALRVPATAPIPRSNVPFAVFLAVLGAALFFALRG